MNYTSADWNQIWIDLYEKNLESRVKGECASIWESKEKAEKFLEQSNQNPDRINRIINILNPDSECRVLDIGAGPGALAVPIAELAGHVTAVEPASGMAEVMGEYAEKKGISNLNIVNKRWEEINPATDLDGPYDIVFACRSLGMPDIKAAIEKMRSVASKRIHLFWFGGITSWEQTMIELWPKLHGNNYTSGPKADVLFNVLYSMGICPNVESTIMDHTRKYSDIESAFNEFSEQYRISTSEQKQILQNYLKESLKNDNGQLSFPGTFTEVRFWWDE